MLSALFEPSSIAVIGASRNPQKVGHSIVQNLLTHGYRGRVYPVNPSASEILSLKSYPSVNEIPDDIDLALLSIPAPAVPEALRGCAEKGVKVAIVISAGFRETGKQGLALEREVREIAEQEGIRVLGPNCLGVINTGASLNATFARGMPPKGKVSFFSQSGALGVAVLDWAVMNNVGFSKFVSLGNKADLNESDFVEYFTQDPSTEVIIGYIEDVVDGRRFMEVARRCTATKPLILIKAGGTGAGSRAASSHTGALAGSDRAFDAAFRQTGVIRATGVKELFEIAKAFVQGRLPKGDRVLIVTNAGGPAIVAADESERQDLKLPVPPRRVVERLRRILPSNASLYNPIDLIGDATSERYRAVLKEMVKSKDMDTIMVILTPQAMTDTEAVAEVVVDAFRASEKVFVTAFMGGETVAKAVEILKEGSVPNYEYPEEAVRAISRVVRFAEWRKRPPGRPKRFRDVDRGAVSETLSWAKTHGITHLTEENARRCLEAYGIAFPRSSLVTTAEAASKEAKRIGFPVVMKVSSPDILHKTDLGGVKLNIRNRKEAEKAFIEIISTVKRRMPQARLQGVNIYEMVTGGKEVIVGVTYDRTFGHMLMFGLGGIYVEVLKDVSFRIVPITEAEAREMIKEVRGYPILRGVRGERPADIEALTETILRVNQLVIEFPEIQEIDINPLVLRERGAVALDARLIIKTGG